MTERRNLRSTPKPQERPDLYDSFDLPERPAGWVNPVNVDYPPHILERVAEVRLARSRKK